LLLAGSQQAGCLGGERIVVTGSTAYSAETLQVGIAQMAPVWLDRVSTLVKTIGGRLYS